ncbi:hypothetical protein [Streptomyces sp. IB2014 016-6]|uniref:hypothetical protein n=1 Tax=Streptomyces sp. IB2014 016-6 TaxID=2517818 RepID=UPI0011C9F399|nr:hypothetical protein [Streptomyces sp. IB2014 016-6]TXL86958.1 hypothetical protein EW053_25295 [Streptomyces sp. IB2014 016-6]
MKPIKVAAVIAGSVLTLGAAAPAFAAQNLPMSLNGGLGGALETVTNQETLDVQPVRTNALDPKNDGSLVNTVGDVANGLSGEKGGDKGGKSTNGGKGGKADKGKGKGAKSKGKGGAMLGGIPLGR